MTSPGWAVLGRPELWVVAAYLLLMASVGIYFSRRQEGGEDYFAGGRRIPWWVSGVSLYMANFSAWLFTGGAGMIYRTTWFGLLYFFITLSVGYLLGSQLTAAQWRRSRVVSPVEYTRLRFGVGTQQLLSLVYSIVFIASSGAQLLAIATVVRGVLGVPIPVGILVIGVVVLLYTLLGGLWAVAVTDVVQFVILLAVTLVVAPLAVGLLDGGLPEMIRGMDSTVIPPPYGAPGQNLHFLFAGLISFTLGTAAGQAPRFYSVPDERSALRVGRLAALLFLTTPLVFAIPPLVARSWYGVPPHGLDALLGVPNAHELVYVRIVSEVFPTALVGVFLAAMFAATMSALDSYYNQVASMLSRDVWGGLIRPRTTDRELLAVGKVATGVVGVLVGGVAFFYNAGVESDLFAISTTILFIAAPAINVPLVLGLLYRRAPRAAGAASIAWGVAMGLYTRLALGWEYGPQTYLTLAAAGSIFLASPWLGRVWRTPAGALRVGAVAALVAALLWGALTWGSAAAAVAPLARLGLEPAVANLVLATLFGASVLPFAARFAAAEDQSGVAAFYRRLDTPVDVATEARGSAASALETFRLVGILTAAIAALVALLGVVNLVVAAPEARAPGRFVALVGILLVLGGGFWWGGRRGAARG